MQPFVCKKFGLERKYSEKSFIIEGFSNWKRSKYKFLSHQISESHRACYILLSNRIVKDANNDSIAAQMIANHKEEVKLNRKHLG